MFQDKSIGVKIAVAFGVLVTISAILGGIGWYGVARVRSYMEAYAKWGDIDMVMNEDVTQKSMRLGNRLTRARLDPSDENFKALEQAQTAAEQGIDLWRSMVEGEAVLEKVAHASAGELALIKEKTGTFRTSLEKTSQIKQQWDQIVSDCLAHLMTTMETQIDPAKARAEDRSDVQEMVRWGAIDMVMNEAVIANVLLLQTAAHDYGAARTPERLEAYDQALKAALDGLTTWRETIGGEAEMMIAADRVATYLEQYEDLGRSYTKEVDTLTRRDNEVNAAFTRLFSSLETAMETVIDPAKDARMAAAAAAQRRSAMVSMAGSIAGMVLGLVLALITAGAIVRPLRRVMDELGSGSDHITEASGQISDASQHLADAASEQAASLEETAASMEELSSFTKKNTDTATRASRVMAEANGGVEQATAVMERVMAAMEEISNASDETQEIVKTIDEIAFQTNLLALNAAVEAARAGEAGAGFAVVADEVRNLAMRAAEAAKTTADLIESTRDKVIQGRDLVTLSSKTFEQVAEKSEAAGGLVIKIVGASQDQAEGIGQINTALAQMDRMVQQVAANAEESASASEEMHGQCLMINQVVGQMDRLIHGDGAAGGSRGATLSQAHANMRDARKIGPGQVLAIQTNSGKS